HTLSSPFMAPAKKPVARMTTYTPPPYPGSSKRYPIDVDATEEERTNLKCTVVLREAKIRKLLREVRDLKDELVKERGARERDEEERKGDLQDLKAINAAITVERDELRGKLESARREMYKVANDMSL
ncbi:hypothetical protein EV714DRAFT_221966, partial [Schizophyllum commune]